MGNALALTYLPSCRFWSKQCRLKCWVVICVKFKLSITNFKLWVCLIIRRILYLQHIKIVTRSDKTSQNLMGKSFIMMKNYMSKMDWSKICINSKMLKFILKCFPHEIFLYLREDYVEYCVILCYTAVVRLSVLYK
jgi:hypothetical protein